MSKIKKIEMLIECPACEGTGVYQGMAEGPGIAVICNKCKGSGSFNYSYHYRKFTERKKQSHIERVYLSCLGYRIGLGKINFEGVGEIDMNKEGVSYEEFLSGKMPKHIKKLACPMLANQDACHRIKGFVDECNSQNGGWISYIPNCKIYKEKEKCWKRFYDEEENND